MDKEKIVSTLKEIGVVAVVRGKNAEDGIRISEACIAGGVTAIEVAFTTPGAQEVIKTLTDKYADREDVLIGAGTVLEPVTCRIAILNGAKFIVAPSLSVETIKMANLYRIPCMPGTTTLNGVVEALEYGVDVVKIFPGDVVGVKMIKDIKGPLPHAQLMPSGGVSVDNVKDWLDAGCAAVSAGSALTKGTSEEVTAKAKQFVAAVKAARA